jgi:hypothetical protein
MEITYMILWVRWAKKNNWELVTIEPTDIWETVFTMLFPEHLKQEVFQGS